ncbi:MAG: nickel pincer cofactor biosynthesis protein LarB [Elusimicrobiota bacterium]|jgi:NCAIR mutase (PurE)-related protein|nr:nickel pincer cofactor biosynthesis protein LarB [Elusimicrobiota bacterium]
MKKANNKKEILNLLKSVQNGKISPEDALLGLHIEPFKNLGFANIDYHRSSRQSTNEVIYGQGKSNEQIFGIVSDMLEKSLKDILITRIEQQTSDFLLSKKIPLTFFPTAKIAVVNKNLKRQTTGCVVIVSGGTSDMPVCEEAAITAETLGSKIERLYDVGVAGIHRILASVEIISKARAIIAVAGMEGALASVVGGLSPCPVIAVPTSVGYGANFKGLSALLSMLNSCANCVSVVNIDNGFGAGFIANCINKMESAK